AVSKRGLAPSVRGACPPLETAFRACGPETIRIRPDVFRAPASHGRATIALGRRPSAVEGSTGGRYGSVPPWLRCRADRAPHGAPLPTGVPCDAPPFLDGSSRHPPGREGRGIPGAPRPPPPACARVPRGPRPAVVPRLDPTDQPQPPGHRQHRLGQRQL